MSDLSVEDLGYKPVTKAPSLVSFYGIGTRLYGHSKIDGQPQLYSKILFFTVLFIPVFALGRYLIERHGHAEFIVGKRSLSGVFKGWNALFAIALVGLFSWNSYQAKINSPEYIAENLYQEAMSAVEASNYKQAVEKLRLVFKGTTSFKSKAQQALVSLANPSNLSQLKPEQVFDIMNGVTPLNHLFPDSLEQNKDWFAKFQTTAPKTASDFAELISLESQNEQEVQHYNQLNYVLLRSIYSEHQEDLSIATRYARLDERLNQCEKCIEILEPHKTTLGVTDSARILGQAYAVYNQPEAAYRLLSPYVDKHLVTYHQAEKAYNEALDKVWNETIEMLNSGKATQTFYDNYNVASEADQRKMVDEFYSKRRDESPAVLQAQEAYINSTQVVPVALDLGMVLLNRSLSMSDLESRNETLKQAEKTFLSVQNYAGESDQYQLYLGQVYYWLGQEEKGEKLFSALLDKYQRSHQILGSLSNTLRDLGAFTKAKEYALEAYNKATDRADKMGYAQYLALLSNDLPEKIEWLEKADTANPYVKGDLLSAKGHLASSEFKQEKALAYYQQSIDVYEKIPESVSQLNNIALIYISKYRLGFDQKDFERALANLDKAVALAPEDSIILSNAAYQHLEKAYTDILTPHIDFMALEDSPSLSHFYFLYKNQQEKDELASSLKKHSSYKKGVSYLEKALLLAPKNVALLNSVYEIYAFESNDQAIAQLASRFETVELDLEQQAKYIREFRSGKEDQKNLKKIDDYLKNLRKTAGKAANKNKLINSVILSSGYFSSLIQTAALGREINAESLLNDARMNYNKKQSSSTRGDLESALIMRLIDQGKSQNQTVASMYAKFNKTLDDRSLFSFAISQDQQFKKYVVSSAEGQELKGLIEQGFKNFPNYPALIDWQILSQLDSKEAIKVKQTILSSPFIKSRDILAFKRTASREQITIHKILKLELNGEHEKAKSLARAAIDDGVLIPELGR